MRRAALARLFRWGPWLAPVVIGLGSLALAVRLYQLDNAHQEAHFADLAGERTATLRHATQTAFRPVQHVAAIFEFAAGAVSEESFRMLAQSLPLAQESRLLALQWIPRETDAAGRDAFPVRYSYSQTTAAEALGTDLLADAVLAPWLVLAGTRPHLSVSPWYRANNQILVRAVRPVFATPANGQPALLGFVAGVYRMDRLLESAWAGGAPGLFEMWVSNGQGGLPGALYYADGMVGYEEIAPDPSSRKPQQVDRVEVFGATWRVLVVAAPGTFVAAPWSAWVIAVGGLALGGLLAFYLRHLQIRDHRVRQLVAQRTDALNRRTQELESIYRSAPVGLAVLDRQLRFQRINDRLAEINGVPAEVHLGKTPREVVPALADAAEALSRQVFATEQPVLNVELHGETSAQPGVERFWTEHWLPLRDKAGRVWGINVVVEETTERRRMEERTRHMAEHDALTDLPNRRLLLELVNAALNRAQRNQSKIALLFLDLDRFKIINDTLGHDAGDTLLKEVASRLAARVRRSDVVSRLGGDEFTVLLSELAHGEQASDVAKEITWLFQQPFQLADQTLYITTSIGISLYPDDADSAEGLLRLADSAMYEAKKQGGNTYRFYNPAIDYRAQARFRTERRLREAIESGELCLRYQPEIDLRTGRTVSVEALVRWDHPELGQLAPSSFIPVAEESDLIVDLDNWVLRTACAQARHWLDQGLSPVCVGVNLSARRFEHPDLVASVQHSLASSRLAPEHLELELAESTLTRHIDLTSKRVRDLVAMGVTVAVDDFGSGDCSFNYLNRMPIGKLKISQSIVRNIASDASDQAFVQALIAMAHTLNKRVIAEGVETEMQRQFLDVAGCDEAQGYLFTAPLPPDQLGDLFVH